MSVPTRSLNARIPHQKLFELLGCQIRSQSLPEFSICPVCRKGGLRIYLDHVDDGAWFECLACHRSGDLIELAAAAWKLELPAAIHKLSREGFDLPPNDQVIQQYLREHIEYRKRLEKLWKDSRTDLIHQSHKLQLIRDRHKLHWTLWGRWESGPGQLVGAISKTDVEEAFAPAVMQHAANRRQTCNPSAHAVFRGEGWADVLVVPFYDLPGRINCFLCIGRDGDPEKDFVIKRANRGCRGNQYVEHDFEAGLAFHPGAIEEAGYVDRKIIAIGDPIRALQLQFRHFESSTRSLPIVTWLDSANYPTWKTGGRRTRTRHAWQMLIGHEVVFWMPHFDVQTLRQAIAINGKISTVGPRKRGEKAMREYCWKYSPADLCSHIRNNAKFWGDVLSDHIANLQNAELEQLFVELEAEGEDVRAVTRLCGYNARTRVSDLENQLDYPRTVFHRKQRIVEIGDEWHVIPNRTGRQELIMNAVLRIDATVMHRRVGECYYRGRILFGGQVIRFFEPMDQIEEDPLNWMRKFLFRQEVGILIFDSTWKNRIIEIAQLFHEPVIDPSIESIGWDEETKRFVLPKFAIHLGGKVEPFHWPLFPDKVPGKELEPPATLWGLNLTSPSANREMESLFWATAACVISNIIAPTFDMEPEGICLEGRGAMAAGKAVAQAMGCLTVPVRCSRDVDAAIHEERCHGFPVVFDIGFDLQRRYRRKLLDRPREWRNCIVAEDWFTARIRALSGGWHVITESSPASPLPFDVEMLAKSLLPAYLKYVVEQGLQQFSDWHDDTLEFVERVIRNLAKFCDEHGGNSGAVLSAYDCLLPNNAGHHPLAFADVLGQLIDEGRLKIAGEPDRRGKPTLLEVPEEDAFLLTYADFVKSLPDMVIEPPRASDLNHILPYGEALVEHREGEFLICRGWLEKRWKQVSLVESGRVKLFA